MGSFGQTLREAREGRGISLEEVAQSTKIRLEYLAALEGDDFERLPHHTFSRGFVRAYAEVVGLDPETAVAACERERKVREPVVAEGLTDVLAELERSVPDKAAHPRSPRRWLLVGGAAAIVLACVAGLAAWRSSARPPAVLPTSKPIAAVVAPVTVREPVPEPTAAAAVVAPASAPGPVEEPPVRAAARPVQVEPSSLAVPEFAVGRGVANRHIVDPGNTFEEGQTVWFWTRVEGATSGDHVRHVWLRNGEPLHALDLELGSASWRTHSSKRMRAGSSGSWRVEARDSAGRVLAASDFTVR
jgi:hypothetical protein